MRHLMRLQAIAAASLIGALVPAGAAQALPTGYAGHRGGTLAAGSAWPLPAQPPPASNLAVLGNGAAGQGGARAAVRRAAATGKPVAVGVSGVVFTVAGTAAGAVHVSLGYRGFAYADAGGFAARLQLVALPGCALTSPRTAAWAWRWNLDYVTDSHGNAEAFFYNTETNCYAANSTASDPNTTATASYIQGGALSKIEYGLQGGSVYGVTPAAEVDFTAPEDRTDIPTSNAYGGDLACSSGASCDVVSPTFWSKYDLTTIETKTLEGSSLQPVDSWSPEPPGDVRPADPHGHGVIDQRCQFLLQLIPLEPGPGDPLQHLRRAEPGDTLFWAGRARWPLTR